MSIYFCFLQEQIVNIHYMLSKSVVKARPSVLWCYKDKLELSRYFFSFFCLKLCHLSFMVINLFFPFTYKSST